MASVAFFLVMNRLYCILVVYTTDVQASSHVQDEETRK